MEGHGLLRAAVKIQRGKACEAEMLASLTAANSSSSCLTLAGPIGTRRGARRKGWIRELLQIAFAPIAPASPLLGGDEQNPRLERATKQPLPSLLGSCELWLSAGRRCEAAMAAAASPQPWPCLVPLVCPLVLPSPNPVGFWSHALYPSTAQTIIVLTKAPRGSSSIWGDTSLFFSPSQKLFSNMWGPWSSQSPSS